MEISRYASRLAAPGTVAVAPPPTDSDVIEILETGGDFGEADTKSGLSASLGIPRDLPQEPEDARLTGGTRSLSRRLLALNIPTARASAERAPQRAFGRAARATQGQKPKPAKRPALSTNWVGQDA